MTGIFLKQHVSKVQTRTNWGSNLTTNQIRYAALDAELTRKLYFKVKDLPLD